MYMDVNKNEKEPESLIQAIRIYIQDKGISFVIEKCSKVMTIRGKR